MTPIRLNCGYVPLVDSAPLIVAQEMRFAADEGLALNLLRQPSWAALRDLLALGHLDVAHMLSPMPAA
ncbi:MAG: ABC transporter substrate-binding protein, partial [Pseudomonadota bacterium]